MLCGTVAGTVAGAEAGTVEETVAGTVVGTVVVLAAEEAVVTTQVGPRSLLAALKSNSLTLLRSWAT